MFLPSNHDDEKSPSSLIRGLYNPHSAHQHVHRLSQCGRGVCIQWAFQVAPTEGKESLSNLFCFVNIALYRIAKNSSL